MSLSLIANVDYAYWKNTILAGLEDNEDNHIVDVILMGALVFAVLIYCQEYFGKITTTNAKECGSTIVRSGDGRKTNAGKGSNYNRAATSNLSYDDRGYGDGRSFNKRTERPKDDDRRRDNCHREPYGRSVDDCQYGRTRNLETTSKPDVRDELCAAGIQNKEYLTLLSDIDEMRTRQIETEKLVEKLRFGGSASDRITSDCRRDDTILDRSAAYPMRHFECTRNYNALKTDFDNLQKDNKKLVHKCSAMKLRLGIVEREMTINQSIVFSGMSCRRLSNFEGPATTRSYADGYYGQPTNHNVAHMSPDPSVRKNKVDMSVSSSSVPPPPPQPTPPAPTPSCAPPPPPPPSCPPPRAAPAKKLNNSNSDVSDPALKVYSPIPITEEILRSVVLRKPTDVPPKIRVPVGMVPATKKE